ncbi:uncharacterized protein LTR77_003419 [Saxophila tyrrhenica]|uniref:DUF7729 domain-containing protein n=1 Tax=Saxophila tyrrhenica TaxID=1690608 RepID=A0AAV9PDP9_9PEZI|nr:hypothetical protein LTR77_003419 [Saxophila tyrrhenica]
MTPAPPDAAVSRAPSSQPGWNAPNSALYHHPSPRVVRIRRAERTYQNITSSSIPRKGRVSGPWTSMQNWVVFVLLSLLLCCEGVEAGSGHGHGRRARELVFDRRQPPPVKARLEVRRKDAARHGSSKSEDSQLLVDDQIDQADLPHPFDTSLGNNFTTTSCPAFFNDFLNNATFQECLPFSLLLQTSNSFFTTTRSLPDLTTTLTATCSVPFRACASLMSSLATQIQSPSTCGPDLSLQNPTVTQAYNGFLAYTPLYHAGCLTDPTLRTPENEKGYCFASAVTNASAPTSSYIYYLPLGVALPGGTQPSCDRCLRRTMGVFADYAGDGGQPLSGVYAAAAQQVDMVCGPTFVEANVVVSNGGASSRRLGGWLGVLAAAGVGVWVGL